MFKKGKNEKKIRIFNGARLVVSVEGGKVEVLLKQNGVDNVTIIDKAIWACKVCGKVIVGEQKNSLALCPTCRLKLEKIATESDSSVVKERRTYPTTVNRVKPFAKKYVSKEAKIKIPTIRQYLDVLEGFKNVPEDLYTCPDIATMYCDLVAKGKTSDTIANMLPIRKATVMGHIRNFIKCGLLEDLGHRKLKVRVPFYYDIEATKE